MKTIYCTVFQIRVPVKYVNLSFSLSKIAMSIWDHDTVILPVWL